MAAFISENTQFFGTDGLPLVNGKIYIGVNGSDPVLNPTNIFSNRGLTSALANPQILDALGKATNKIWIPDQYSYQIDDSNDVQIFQDLDAGILSSVGVSGLSNVLGTNAITAEASPTISALTDQQQFTFKVANTNTGAITLDIDGQGAKSVFRNVAQEVVSGQFVANQIAVVQYNSSDDAFHWVNENQKVHYDAEGADIASAATVDLLTATGNTLNVTGSENITALGTVPAGAVFKLKIPGDVAVSITSSSVANPSQILCAAAHLGTTGDEVYISGHSGSVPDINGFWPITVIDADEFTIPVNVTTGGTGGTIQLVPKFTHNGTSLILPDAVDLTPLPGSTLEFESLGSGNWILTDYQNGIIAGQVANHTDAVVTSSPSQTLLLSVARGLDLVQQFSSEAIVVLSSTNAALPIPDWANLAIVFLTGGGGGGGAGVINPHGGGGGGGGGQLVSRIPVTAGGTLNCVVGAGGAKQVAGGNTTIDGANSTANGGAAGANAAGAGGAGGAGGTTSGAIGVKMALADGSQGGTGATGGAVGGIGGRTSGPFSVKSAAAQGAGKISGGGGGGGNNGNNGGAGGDGRILIIFIG